ncbi:hypothetical protein FJY68_09420 [candidate division WOR-3 bacterium]|uniref:SLBB domain-containing protein n=1 Tax=candidate division WOR-3 bacterium TaxID=2052148 RepID=A0A938BQD1_UNCW3|nr:hypothetical protein [candidate division WOR-3 bacterium]
MTNHEHLRSVFPGSASPVSSRFASSLLPVSSCLGSKLRLLGRGVAALVCLGLTALAVPVAAQPAAGSRAPVFKYYVWGQVRTPGAYVLGGSPDLLELLSAAGGPTEHADVRRLVLFEATTQKQKRIDVKKVLAAGQVIPLSPGDVVLVPNSPWYSLRYVLDAVTTVASVATLAMTAVILSRQVQP